MASLKTSLIAAVHRFVAVITEYFEIPERDAGRRDAGRGGGGGREEGETLNGGEYNDTREKGGVEGRGLQTHPSGRRLCPCSLCGNPSASEMRLAASQP